MVLVFTLLYSPYVERGAGNIEALLLALTLLPSISRVDFSAQPSGLSERLFYDITRLLERFSHPRLRHLGTLCRQHLPLHVTMTPPGLGMYSAPAIAYPSLTVVPGNGSRQITSTPCP